MPIGVSVASTAWAAAVADMVSEPTTQTYPMPQAELSKIGSASTGAISARYMGFLLQENTPSRARPEQHSRRPRRADDSQSEIAQRVMFWDDEGKRKRGDPGTWREQGSTFHRGEVGFGANAAVDQSKENRQSPYTLHQKCVFLYLMSECTGTAQSWREPRCAWAMSLPDIAERSRRTLGM
eukprot:3130518-Rhodomonas_salina.1